MNEKYICYCGLYCENCAVKARVEPAARVLYNEMKKADFEYIVPMLPSGIEFWEFLKAVATEGSCKSCQDGSGNPSCAVRLCAKEKNVTMCALCESYPCEHFKSFFPNYTMLKEDNELLRNKGIDEWAKMQDKRCENGYSYAEEKLK